MAPLLFNIHTNDHPRGFATRHFLYADDLVVAAQESHFIEIEEIIKESLATLTDYYVQNY